MFVSSGERASRPDFHNGALEDFECLLDERVVFEALLVEDEGLGFVGFRGPGDGFERGAWLGPAVCNRRRFGSGRSGDGPGGRRLQTAGTGRGFRLDELDLAAVVAQLAQLRLQHRMVFRVVHERKVLGELGVEADGEELAVEGNRVRLQQVAAGELAHAAHGLKQLRPERVEVGGAAGLRLGEQQFVQQAGDVPAPFKIRRQGDRLDRRSADVQARDNWDDYMKAYEEALRATSTEHAPWYVIPADRKYVTRSLVSGIVRQKLEDLKLKYPVLPDDEKAWITRELEEEKRARKAVKKKNAGEKARRG